jgi:hypothetical protein
MARGLPAPGHYTIALLPLHLSNSPNNGLCIANPRSLIPAAQIRLSESAVADNSGYFVPDWAILVSFTLINNPG